MNINDIFIGYKDEPKCLYCKNIVNLLARISSNICHEYICTCCHESYSVQFDGISEGPRVFTFSLFDKEIFVDLKKEKFGISYSGKKVTDWLLYFKFDFSSKKKLNDKINTLMTYL